MSTQHTPGRTNFAHDDLVGQIAEVQRRKQTPGPVMGYWWECGRTKARSFATASERLEFAQRLKERGLTVTCEGIAIAKATGAAS